MAETLTDIRSFRAERAWGARDIALIEGASVRLHWTDQPYHWHVNDGPEVFVVLNGVVDMHFIEEGEERCERLTATDIFYADTGRRHVAGRWVKPGSW